MIKYAYYAIKLRLSQFQPRERTWLICISRNPGAQEFRASSGPVSSRHACQPFMKSASLTRLDEYRLGSVDERVGIIISTPIKRMTRRDAGKVNLVIT